MQEDSFKAQEAKGTISQTAVVKKKAIQKNQPMWSEPTRLVLKEPNCHFKEKSFSFVCSNILISSIASVL